MASQQPDPSEFVTPLIMNGLAGRKLRLPGKTSREILVVYDAPTTLEHLFGLASSLAAYGTVTIPDLPGFGGMQSFYRIHERPTTDNLADYLAAFVKLQYKRRRITIIGMSFGMVVATRMLQKYPELSHKVDAVVSLFGYVHHEDFKGQSNQVGLSLITGFYAMAVPARLAQTVLASPLLPLVYGLKSRRRTMLRDTPPSSTRLAVALWRKNHFRTRMYIDHHKLRLDLCNQPVRLPVYHLVVSDDAYLDNHLIEQHLGVIFQSVTVISTKLQGYAPKVLSTSQPATWLLPTRLRRVLRTGS